MFAEFPGYHQGGTFPLDVAMVCCTPSFQQFTLGIRNVEKEQRAPVRNGWFFFLLPVFLLLKLLQETSAVLICFRLVFALPLGGRFPSC